jgi:putative DNA-invertase from lambdoid prophage Rac
VINRVQAEPSMVSAAVKALGRPQALSNDQQEAIRRDRAAGVSLGVLVKQYTVSRAAIQRVEKRVE